MSRKDIKHDSLIANIPIFQGLTGPALHMLEGMLKEKEFLKGENIFMEGSDTTGFYIIMKGRVKIFKLSADGKEQILHIAGQKELLGAVSAFSGDPYPAHADAIEKTVSLFFPRKDFLALTKKEPSVVMNMMANLARRLQQFTKMIEDLSLKEVPGRVAAYLLYLCRQSEGDTVEIDISRAQLASLLGTIPETLSRILRRMSDKGILEVRGRSIRLLDKNRLDYIVNEKIRF